jgi:hypothetical protein
VLSLKEVRFRCDAGVNPASFQTGTLPGGGGVGPAAQNWLNPADLVRRVPEVVPGYPDRILPVDDAAAAVLKKRTLTNLYNARPAWLDHAHAALDRAVADAYGWGEDWRAGRLDDEAILGRLFALNQARAGRGPAGGER